jgi:transcriptional regulator with XRE-family HTH domain
VPWSTSPGTAWIGGPDRLAKAVGVSPGTVSAWLVGRSVPREDLTARLEHAVHVEAGSFFWLLGHIPYSDQITAVVSVRDAIEADSRRLARRSSASRPASQRSTGM